jgi:hypothetical protein
LRKIQTSRTESQKTLKCRDLYEDGTNLIRKNLRLKTVASPKIKRCVLKKRGKTRVEDTQQRENKTVVLLRFQGWAEATDPRAAEFWSQLILLVTQKREKRILWCVSSQHKQKNRKKKKKQSLLTLHTNSALDSPISPKSATAVASLLQDQNLQPLPEAEINHHTRRLSSLPSPPSTVSLSWQHLHWNQNQHCH